MVKRRNPVLAIIDIYCPAGVTFLPAFMVEHPEARRVAELPFVWAIGRVKIEGKMRAVDERRLAIERIGVDNEYMGPLLVSYAAFVVNNPVDGPAKRLHGKLLDSWVEQLPPRQRAMFDGCPSPDDCCDHGACAHRGVA